jgi:hypothetical protein
MCNAFKFLPLAFGIVLVLIVRLTLPIFDDKGTKDVKDILADFDLGTVTNELVHGTTRTDDVLEGGWEFTGGFHPIDVDDV